MTMTTDQIAEAMRQSFGACVTKQTRATRVLNCRLAVLRIAADLAKMDPSEFDGMIAQEQERAEALASRRLADAT
jgi:hypothetical protein